MGMHEGGLPHSSRPSPSPPHTFLPPPSPAVILFLYLPLEGKTKGLGEVTGIAGEGREE